MPPHEKFPIKGLEGAPSNDIGWHFGTPVPNTKGNVVCKPYGKVVKGGITRFKEHIAHKTGNVAPCPNATGKQLEKVSNHNTSGIEGKNSDEVLVVGIIFMKKGDLLMDQLENIMKNEQVNPSQEFKESKWGQQKLGPTYEAKKIVLGKDFWKKANDLIKVYEPLEKVLRLVDSDEKPTMGFIYEAIGRAKQAIQQD
ncbi:hypothetical protein PVK06_049161 [Gossypium arboreum]|uniref:Uncharacterized protein n=1 Tax=Gossypium arboreum TaxID=29729 RepID=A0ABR0MJT8_GOSAR|nr:hypothetical protein PVK06_049161 [Gossypium arboreum]